MTDQRTQLLSYISRIRSAPLMGMTDSELLRRFTFGEPDADPAFEVLVRRHGPHVFRVCRSAVGDAHAAEDCFQATFLVLVRRARFLGRDRPLGPWLFGVARRVCQRARVAAARRAKYERLAAVPADAAAAARLEPDVAVLVHAEVGRLPRALRAVAVLCDLAGLTYQEAADRLGVPQATVRGRLARARERLRRGLGRKGIGADVLPAIPVLVPHELLSRTAEAAAVMAGRATGTVPATILYLVSGGLQSMFVTNAKSMALFCLTSGVLISGALGLAARQDGPASATPATTGGISQMPPRDDPGDEVAALVHRAQRQEDRQNFAAAKRTLDKAEEALRKWRDRLESPDRQGDPRGAAADFTGRAATVANPAGQRLPYYGLNPLTATPGAVPAASAAGKSSDMESRMRELESKLDRLIREFETRNRGANSSAEQPKKP